MNNRIIFVVQSTVVSNTLRSHELQHAQLPCPSLSLGVCSHLSIQSVMPSNHLILCHPLLLLPSIFLRIRDFSNELPLCISWPKYGTPTSASVLPKKIQDLFPLGLNGLISLQSTRLSRIFSNTTVQKYQFLGTQLSLWSTSHPYMTIRKTTDLTSLCQQSNVSAF